MKREDELQQEYEDILFKIMMDRVAQAEGARLLEENQQLLEAPDAEVPQTVQKHAYKTIQTAFSKKKRSRRMGSLRRGLRVAAIAAILVALLTGVTFAAFPDVRAKVINTIKDIYETHTNFIFTENNVPHQEIEIIAGWIPEGFSIQEEGVIDTSAWKVYKNESDSRINIEKSLPISSSIDTENAEMTTTTIHGFEATLITKTDEARIIWLDTDDGIVYFVNVEKLPVETLLKIAENVS